MRVQSALTTLLFLAAANNCFAGASFDFEKHLRPLLERDSALGRHLLDTLEFGRVGVSTRVGRRASRHLGGTRIGPYEIPARPKGSKGAFIFRVTIEAEQVYSDASGKSMLPDEENIFEILDKAVSVNETPKSFKIEIDTNAVKAV